MADEYKTESSQPTTHTTTYVTQKSGWSTFWKWVGTIVVVLLIAMVVIYVANTFLLGESMRTQALTGQDDGSGSKIQLDINGGGDSGSGGSSDSGSSSN